MIHWFTAGLKVLKAPTHCPLKCVFCGHDSSRYGSRPRVMSSNSFPGTRSFARNCTFLRGCEMQALPCGNTS
eukprot:3668022-Rhodomonas_salina.2